MVVIEIETLGDERMIRGFNRYVEDMEDFTEPFKEIAEYFFRREEDIFDREGDPAAFAELSPRYKAWKDRHYPGKKIMELTGRLRGSLTGQHQSDSQDTIMRIGKKEAEFGTRVPYALRHQRGSGELPKRKVVQLTEEDKTAFVRIIQRYAFKQSKERIDNIVAPSLRGL